MGLSCVISSKNKRTLGEKAINVIKEYTDKNQSINTTDIIKEVYKQSYERFGKQMGVQDFTIVLMAELPNVLLRIYTDEIAENNIANDIVRKNFNDDKKLDDLLDLVNQMQNNDWLSNIKEILGIQKYDKTTPLSFHYIQRIHPIIDKSVINVLNTGQQIVVNKKDGNNNVLELKTVKSVIDDKTVVCYDNSVYNVSDFSIDSLFHLNGNITGKSIFNVSKSDRRVQKGDLLEFKFELKEHLYISEKNNNKYIFFLNILNAKGVDINSVEHDNTSVLPTRIEQNIIDAITDNGRITDPKDYNKVFAQVTKVNPNGSFEWKIITPIASYDVLGKPKPIEVTNFDYIPKVKGTISEEMEMYINTVRMSNILYYNAGIPTGSNNFVVSSDNSMEGKVKNKFLELLIKNKNIVSAGLQLNKLGYEDIHLISKVVNNKISFVVCDKHGEPCKFTVSGDTLIKDKDGVTIEYDLDNTDLNTPEMINDPSKKNVHNTTVRVAIATYLNKFLPGKSDDEKIDFYLKEVNNIRQINQEILTNNKVVHLRFANCGIFVNHQTSKDKCARFIKGSGTLSILSTHGLSTSIYGQIIKVQPDKFPQSFVDYMTALILEDNIIFNGNKLTPQARAYLFKQYFSNNAIELRNDSAKIIMVESGKSVGFVFISKGNSYDIAKFDENGSTTLYYNKERLKTRINTHLSTVDENGFAAPILSFLFDAINNDSINNPVINQNADGSYQINTDKKSLEDTASIFDYYMLALKKYNDIVPDIREYISVKAAMDYQVDNPVLNTSQEAPVKKVVTFDDTDSFNRSREYERLSKKVSPEQNEAAREWFKNSRFSSTFDFDDARRMANQTAVARWTRNGIILFEGAEDVDIYHEAWHEFSQLYLSGKQWNELAKEVRSKSGSFIDYQGVKVNFSEANDLQIEEYLAEEFRSFMINKNKRVNNKSAISRFFNKIWNILKTFFTNKENLYSVNELFNKLADNDIYEFNRSENNARHELLNRGLSDNYLRHKGYTEKEIIDAMSIIDSLVTSSIIGSKNILNINELFNLLDDKNNFLGIYKKVYSQLEGLLAFYEKKLQINSEKEVIDERYKEQLEYNIELVKKIKNDFWEKGENGRNKMNLDFGFAAHHLQQSKIFSDIVKESEEEDEVDALLSAAQEHNKEANAESTSERMSKIVHFILTILPGYKRNEDGEWVKDINEYHVRRRFPFEYINNKLINLLHNTTSITEIYDKLVSVEGIYPPIKDLLSVLGNPNEILDYDENERMTRMLVWSQFAQVYKSSQTDLIQTSVTVENENVEVDGIVRNEKVISTTVGVSNGPKFKLRSLYQDKFNSLDNDSKYVIVSVNQNTLNIKKIIEDFSGYVDEIGTNGSRKRVFPKNNRRKFLRACGIYVTNDIGIDKYLEDDSFDDFFTTLWINIVKNQNATITDIYNDVIDKNKYLSSQFQRILELDLEFTNEINVEMVQNAEGSTQFKTMLNNTISQKLNYLNKYDNFLDAIKDNALKDLNCFEYLYDFDHPDAPGIYKPKEKNPKCNYNLLHSKFLKSQFNLEFEPDGSINLNKGFGQRIRGVDKMSMINLSGIKITDANGTSVGQKLFNTDKKTKVIADLSLSTRGYYEFIRHSDKSTSYGFTTPFKNEWFKYDAQLSFIGGRVNEDFYKSQFMNLIKPYLAAEICRVIATSEYKENKILHNANLLANSNILGVFDDMMSNRTKEQLQELVNKKLPYDKILEALNSETISAEYGIDLNVLQNDLYNYIEKQIQTNNDIFNKYVWSNNNIFKKNLDNMKHTYNKNSKPNDYTAEQYAMCVYFTINNLFYNIECINFTYGNTLQYNLKKDEFIKRLGGFTSSGKVFDTSDIINDYIDSLDSKDSSHGSYAAKYLGERRSTQYLATDQLHTAVCADINPKSFYYDDYKKYMSETFYSKYENIEEESNAQGLISFDAYRQLKIREGDWSPVKELLFQRIVNGEEVKEEDIHEYFPVYKLQYEGPLETKGMPAIAFHKYSLFPLIPSVIKDTNLERIHHRMIEEGIHYITFVSGSKITTLTKERDEKNARKGLFSSAGDILYDPETVDWDKRSEKDENGNYVIKSNRKLSEKFDSEIIDKDNKIIDENRVFTVNTIPLAYLKDQLVVHDHLETQVVFSTQMRRLIINNLMENGVPFDFEQGVENRESHWLELYEKSKSDDPEIANKAKNEMKDKSSAYQLIKKYEWSIRTLTEIAQEEIKNKIGYRKDDKGNVVVDKEKLLSWIKSELSSKDVPDFILDEIKNTDDLSFSLYTKEIENAIMSMINRKAIRQRVHGGQYVQVADTFWEKPNSENFVNGSNDLKFYDEITVEKDGKKVLTGISCATVKIPLAGDFLNLLHLKYMDTGEEIKTLDRLNECLLNKEWRAKHIDYISFVACRIPVQGHNSIESFEIEQFVPGGCNNIIICPPEEVVKAGSDYDVDKLSCIMPNISMLNGVPTVISSDNAVYMSKEERRKLSKEENELKKQRKDAIKEYNDNFVKEFKNIDIDAYLQNINDEKRQKVQTLIDEFNRIQQDEEDLLDTIEKIKRYAEIDDDRNIEQEKEKLLYQKHKDSIKLAKEISSMLDIKFDDKKYQDKINDITEKLNAIQVKTRAYSRDSLENTIIKCAKQMLAMSVNIKSLLTPNSTELFSNGKGTGIADEFKNNASYNRFSRISDEENDTMSPTRLIEYQYSLEKHDDFNTGKTILGPVAIDNVFSAVVRRVGCTMNEYSYSEIPEESRKYIENEETRKLLENNNWRINSENYMDVAIKIMEEYKILNTQINSLSSNISADPAQYNTYIKRRSELKRLHTNIVSFRKQTILLPYNQINGRINLAAEYDAENENQIAEIISEYINGCVDVAKDAWIKYIQGNMHVIPTFMFMIQAGIPLKQTCYMICNPAVVNYINNKLNDDSPSALLETEPNYFGETGNRLKALGVNKADFQTNKLENDELLYNMIDGIIKDRKGKQFTEEELRKRAHNNSESYDINATENEYDKAVLAQYILIEDMAKSMNSLKLAVRVDASKNNTVREVVSKQNQYHNIQGDQRIEKGTMEKIMHDSVLRSFFMEDFVNDTIDTVIPYYANKEINDYAINNIEYDVVNETFNGDRTKAQEKFITEFLNFLYQRNIKQTSDDSFRLSERFNNFRDVIEKNELFPYETLYDTEEKRNKFYENLTKIRNDFQGHRSSEIINSESFKIFDESTKDVLKNRKDEEKILNYMMLMAHHRTASSLMLFEHKYDFSYAWNMVSLLISKYPKLNNYSVLSNLMSDKKDTVINKKRSTFHNIHFRSQPDSLQTTVYNSEIKRLQDFDAVNDTINNPIDSIFINEFFKTLPIYSVILNGYNSSGLNKIMDQTDDIKNLYYAWSSLDEKDRLNILNGYLFAFNTKFSPYSPSKFRNNSFEVKKQDYVDLDAEIRKIHLNGRRIGKPIAETALESTGLICFNDSELKTNEKENDEYINSRYQSYGLKINGKIKDQDVPINNDDKILVYFSTAYSKLGDAAKSFYETEINKVLNSGASILIPKTFTIGNYLSFYNNIKTNLNYQIKDNGSYVEVFKVNSDNSSNNTPTESTNVIATDPFFADAIAIDYKPEGQEKRTFYIKGNHIYNINKEEVYKEGVASTEVHRRLVLAKREIKLGNAVVMDYEDEKYIVFRTEKIISVKSKNYVYDTQGSQDNGVRDGIINKSKIQFNKLDNISENGNFVERDEFSSEDYNNLQKPDESNSCKI